MNKLQQIAQDLKDNPTLFDYYSYSKEWTIPELNQLMMAEYLEDVKALATKMNRSEYSVILKYLEVRDQLDSKLALDARIWEGQQTETALYTTDTDWNVSDFIPGVSVINMKLGEILEVNVRITDPALRLSIPENLKSRWSHFGTFGEDLGGGHLFGGERTTALNIPKDQADPDKWGFIRLFATVAGHMQLGMAVRDEVGAPFAISKTMFVNIINE